MKQRNALISVYNKGGIVGFAKGLHDLGFTIFSSGGTAQTIQGSGTPVIDVAKLTGFPAILDHRVVTLSPKIHGGILALNTPEHNADMKKYKLTRFHLVCGDLYPVQTEIARHDATIDSVMNQTDIGGPTMIRGAAKNHKNVIVICDPGDRKEVLRLLKETGDIPPKMRQMLAAKVFDLMSDYDEAIAQFLINH